LGWNGGKGKKEEVLHIFDMDKIAGSTMISSTKAEYNFTHRHCETEEDCSVMRLHREVVTDMLGKYFQDERLLGQDSLARK